MEVILISPEIDIPMAYYGMQPIPVTAIALQSLVNKYNVNFVLVHYFKIPMLNTVKFDMKTEHENNEYIFYI